MAATASPFIAPTRSSLTSSNTLGSSKWVQARTIAFARFSASLGSQKFRPSAMKIPDPTNTASAPSCRTSAASAGEPIPQALEAPWPAHKALLQKELLISSFHARSAAYVLRHELRRRCRLHLWYESWQRLRQCVAALHPGCVRHRQMAF